MDFALVKKLADSGFSKGILVWYGKDLKTITEVDNEPTLEELIEACGEEFFVLKVYFIPEIEWVAMPRDSSKILKSQHYGKTPQEAVARLWLALNKK